MAAVCAGSIAAMATGCGGNGPAPLPPSGGPAAPRFAADDAARQPRDDAARSSHLRDGTGRPAGRPKPRAAADPRCSGRLATARTAAVAWSKSQSAIGGKPSIARPVQPLAWRLRPRRARPPAIGQWAFSGGAALGSNPCLCTTRAFRHGRFFFLPLVGGKDSMRPPLRCSPRPPKPVPRRPPSPPPACPVAPVGGGVNPSRAAIFPRQISRIPLPPSALQLLVRRRFRSGCVRLRAFSEIKSDAIRQAQGGEEYALTLITLARRRQLASATCISAR